VNTDQTTTTPEPCTLRVHFKSERHAIEQLFLKVFGATPVYPPPLMQIDKDGIMRPVPWERPTPDESDVLTTLERLERELAEAREQRDRLAEVLNDAYEGNHGWASRAIDLLKSLAAVKGGQG
jgi:hypothetical protein